MTKNKTANPLIILIIGVFIALVAVVFFYFKFKNTKPVKEKITLLKVFSQQRTAYQNKMEPNIKAVVDKSNQLIDEAVQMIGNNNCLIQRGNSSLFVKLTQLVKIGKALVAQYTDNAFLHFNLGYVYNWARCYDFGGDNIAQEELQKAIDIDPNLLEARMYLGGVLINMQKYKEAIPHFEAIISKVDDCSYCYQSLGEIYTKLGDKTKAKDALGKAKNLK